jgi:hypothetical protein
MKFCTACGEAAHGQRFCTRCGAVLRAQPGQAAGQFRTTTVPGPPDPGPALAGQGPSAGQRPPSLPPAWQWPAAESERLASWPPAGPAPARTAPGAVAHSGTGPSPGGRPGRERGRIWLVAVIVVLLAAAGAAGGWFFLSHRSHPAVRVATAPAGATFVLEHVPPGYHASAQSCPS